MYLVGQPPPPHTAHPAGLPLPWEGRQGVGEPPSRFWHDVGCPSSMDRWMDGRTGEGCGRPGAGLRCKASRASLGCLGAHHPGIWARRQGDGSGAPKLAPSDSCRQYSPTCTPRWGQATASMPPPQSDAAGPQAWSGGHCGPIHGHRQPTVNPAGSRAVGWYCQPWRQGHTAPRDQGAPMMLGQWGGVSPGTGRGCVAWAQAPAPHGHCSSGLWMLSGGPAKCPLSLPPTPLAVPTAGGSGRTELISTGQPAPGEVGQCYSHFTDGETEVWSREGTRSRGGGHSMCPGFAAPSSA